MVDKIQKKTSKFKDLYSCPIEIINRLTDKGQFSVSHWIKETPRGDLPVYNIVSFTKINNINNLSKNT